MQSEPHKPVLHPAYVQRALDTEAEAWAQRTNIVDGWLARMSSDPRTIVTLRKIAVLAFTEGLYEGALNVINGKPLSITVEDALAQAQRAAPDEGGERG